jgi:PAS domain S-box-containing protein
MTLQITPYAVPVVLTAALTFTLAAVVSRRRPPGVVPFVLLMVAVTEWLLAYALELSSVELAGRLLWARVEYLGITSIPVLWLIYVLQYTGRAERLSGANIALLAIIPVATNLMVWTNDAHGLHWASVAMDPRGALAVTYGPWFWISASYAYILLLLGAVFLFQAFLRAPDLYRGQVGSMLVATLTPWIGNGLYISGLSPLGDLDLTPFGFAVTGVAMTWGMRRYRLLEIVPLARHAVVEGMRSAVIILDMDGRVVDLNPAAERTVGRSASDMIGKQARKLFSDQRDLVDQFSDVEEVHTEIALGLGEAARYFELRISPLTTRRGRRMGRLIVLLDVTERKRQSQQLERVTEIFSSTVEHLIVTVERGADKSELHSYLSTIRQEFEGLS